MKSNARTIVALAVVLTALGLDAGDSNLAREKLPGIGIMQLYPTPDPEWGDEMPGDVVHEGCPVKWQAILPVTIYSLSEMQYTFVYEEGHIMASTLTSNGGSYDFGDLRSRAPMTNKAILRGARIINVSCWKEEVPWLPDRHWIELGDITARRLDEIAPATPYATTTNTTTAHEPTYETWCKFLNEWSDTGMLISSEMIIGSCWTIQVT
jgi:hypothetical protein